MAYLPFYIQNSKNALRCVFIAVLLCAGTAFAWRGQAWSAIGPRTVAKHRNIFEATLGWPSISLGYLRGVAPRLNMGARFSFVYGVEGILARQVAPGFKAQAVAKYLIFNGEIASFGITCEPGLLFHFYGSQSLLAGIAFPLSFRFGMAASSALQVALLIDVPLWIEIGARGSFIRLPILTGMGVEYFLLSNFAAFFRVRMGPTIYANGDVAAFTLESVVGLGWKF